MNSLYYSGIERIFVDGIDEVMKVVLDNSTEQAWTNSKLLSQSNYILNKQRGIYV